MKKVIQIFVNIQKRMYNSHIYLFIFEKQQLRLAKKVT